MYLPPNRNNCLLPDKCMSFGKRDSIKCIYFLPREEQIYSMAFRLQMYSTSLCTFDQFENLTGGCGLASCRYSQIKSLRDLLRKWPWKPVLCWKQNFQLAAEKYESSESDLMTMVILNCVCDTYIDHIWQAWLSSIISTMQFNRLGHHWHWRDQSNISIQQV